MGRTGRQSALAMLYVIPTNMSVLVVDDEPGILSALAEYLGSLGCGVDTAVNGQEALAKTQTSAYHLILCDIAMPVMTGFELLDRWLAADHPPCWFVLMSAIPEGVVRTTTTRYTRYLPKPLHFKELANVVEACRVSPEIAARLNSQRTA